MDEMLDPVHDAPGPAALQTPMMTWLPLLLAATATLVVFCAVHRGLRRLLATVSQKTELDRMVAPFIQTVLQFTLGTIGVLMVLGQLGIDTSSVFASFGVMGLTAGFAPRNILSNVISGVFVFGDRPFVIGDLIVADVEYGRVETIILRSTRLVTPDGKRVAIPYASVANGKVRSYTNFTGAVRRQGAHEEGPPWTRPGRSYLARRSSWRPASIAPDPLDPRDPAPPSRLLPVTLQGAETRTIVHWTQCLPSNPASPRWYRVVADQDGQWFALFEALGEASAIASTLDVAEDAFRIRPPTADLDAANASVQVANAAVYWGQSTPSSTGAVTVSIGAVTVSIPLAALRGTRAVLAQVGRTGASALGRGGARTRPCTTPDTAVDDGLSAGLGSEASRAASDERFVQTLGLGALPVLHPRSKLLELMPGDRLVPRSYGVEAISICAGEDGAALFYSLASNGARREGAESFAAVIDVCGMLETYLGRTSDAGPLKRHPMTARIGRAPWRWLCGLGQPRRLSAGQVLLPRGHPVGRRFASPPWAAAYGSSGTVVSRCGGMCLGRIWGVAAYGLSSTVMSRCLAVGPSCSPDALLFFRALRRPGECGRTFDARRASVVRADSRACTVASDGPSRQDAPVAPEPANYSSVDPVNHRPRSERLPCDAPGRILATDALPSEVAVSSALGPLARCRARP